VLAIDAEHDLALISAENIPVNHPIATVLNTQTIHDGDRVHIVGHTIGLWWTYCEGNVSSMWANIKGPTGIEVQALQISSPAWFGNSGGGAYDERGNLIGIASWVTTRAPNISFFVHHDEIVTFLQKHLKKA
jgi:S1-C subfamily serine protease